MSNYNNNDNITNSSDPTFDRSGNAAVGEFYSSGGKNDSTGREPFEDSISRGVTGGENYNSGSTGVGSGSSGRGLGGETSEGQYGSSGTGAGAYGSSGLNRDDNYRGTDSADQYGSNSAARDYSSNTGGLTGGRGSDNYGSSTTAGGVTGAGATTGLSSGSDTYRRAGGAGYGGQTGDDYGSSGNTGDNYGDARQTGDNMGTDRSAGYDRDQGGAGNMGVRDYQGSDRTGVTSGGAAGTDRFDVDRSSSGVTGSGSATDRFDDRAGNPAGDKTYGAEHTNVGRTGAGEGVGSSAFDQPATGEGAYNNPYAKTGLTGREGSAGGANPGDNTRGTNDTGAGESHAGGGLLGKVKQALGGNH